MKLGQWGLYLGCIHEEGQLVLEDGRVIRYCTFNSEDFLRDKVDRYLEICESLGGLKVKLSTVTTPYLRGSARKSCARKPEDDGEKAYMCKWCRHAFSIKRAEPVPFTNGTVVRYPWCTCPTPSVALLEPCNFVGQMSRKKIKKTHDLPSFVEINEKMKAELDDDDESTKYEDSEVSVPPYADYGIMNNDITQLPKEFMTSDCRTEPASSVDATSQRPQESFLGRWRQS